MERDTDDEYRYYCDEEDPEFPTLLHLAAERNFVHVSKLLVEKYPALVYIQTERRFGDERGHLPVEKALMSYKDEAAAYLISQMEIATWVTLVSKCITYTVIFTAYYAMTVTPDCIPSGSPPLKGSNHSEILGFPGPICSKGG